jgi:hypothetical protein
MMDRHRRDELATWLKTATHGLPRAVSDMVRAEIEAHYHDAVADYQSEEKESEEAHRAALADLGDPEATARALRETHLTARRYVITMGLSLAFLLLYYGLPMAILALTGSEVAVGIALSVVIFVLTVFVLLAFKRLVAQHPDAHRLDKSVAIAMWGLGADASAASLSLLVYGIPAITHTYERTLWEVTPLVQVIFDWVALIGVFGVGFGLLGAARVLRRQGDSLYGLRDPLTAALGFAGLAAVGFPIGLLLCAFAHTESAAGVLMVLTVVFHTIIHITIVFAVLALLFFWARFRGRPDPLQAV